MSNNITFNLSAGFEKLNNMYFFTPDTISSYENKFQLIYDNMDLDTFSSVLPVDLLPLCQAFLANAECASCHLCMFVDSP